MRRALLAVAACCLLMTACLDPTTGRPPAPSAPAPAYRSYVTTVTAAELGASWHAGCPVGPADLRKVRVDYWGYDGKVHRGDLVVHRTAAAGIATVFGRLYAGRFQIQRIHPVARYGGSDAASMDDNNTSAFNCRVVAGTTKLSEHAYGTAIDLNPVQNPYVTRSGSIEPPKGKPWSNRDLRVPGMVHQGDVAQSSFAAIGWAWGGAWATSKDYQHFSASGG